MIILLSKQLWWCLVIVFPPMADNLHRTPGEGPSRKRGRPRRAVASLVSQSLELSSPAVAASSSTGVDLPRRNRGRPPVVVIAEVLERRRISRQRVEASRPQREGPSRKRGRPRGVQAVVDLPTGSAIPAHVTEPHEEELIQGSTPHLRQTIKIQAQGLTQPQTTPKPHALYKMTMPQLAVEGNMALPTTSVTTGLTTGVQSNEILNIGKQDQTCGFCKAQVWAAEFTGRLVGGGPKGYSICCGKGKLQLPLLREPPHELRELITSCGIKSAMYFSKSRVYNNIFAFCSFGGNV